MDGGLDKWYVMDGWAHGRMDGQLDGGQKFR